MDPVSLAGAVVANFLLPYVKLGAERFADEIGEHANSAAAEQVVGIARQAWARVKDAFGAKHEASALEQFERRPEVSGPVVEQILAEILDDDKQLARELEELIGSRAGDGRPGIQIVASSDVQVVAAYAEIRNAVVIGKFVGDSGAQLPRPPLDLPPPDR